ncbi:lysine--tRNA ligase [Plantactinospora solaniradicis]|uniref:Lysine--tRNA ligase n=1 Tax=Plantactinospora solaniradicis TaxID=1723736 RepID=A0ABW1KS61_9ACTN
MEHRIDRTDDGGFEQLQVRLSKRSLMLEADEDPYPVAVTRTHELGDLRRTYGTLPPDTVTGSQVSIVGRVIFLRDTGNLRFATLRDGGGDELQVMLTRDRVGTDRMAAWKRLVDLGDIVEVNGEVATSRLGELSVLASCWRMAAKAVRPLPTAHKPLSEEARVRQRYIDLIVRPGARDAVRLRADVVRSVREELHRRRFVEVETPMLQLLPGGANARPFRTHCNALDTDLFLRVAPELFLKRCVVGGLDRVFEINRNFRNEGIDSSHSPEFAMLEAYEAFGDYRSMAVLTRELVQTASQAAFGSTVARHADGTEFDVSDQVWREVTLFGALSEALGEEVTVDTPVEMLRAHAEKREIDTGLAGPGKLAEKLFDVLVAPTLIAPTFVMDYPEETSPLTRHHRTAAGLAERWDLYVSGFELATGYSELVDPVVQRDRLTAQARLKTGGDPEAMRLDEDFLRAIEHGMPPSGGIGMGIDRLLMALSGLGIRDTILFPLVRPGS